jgi:hypothetical protein
MVILVAGIQKEKGTKILKTMKIWDKKKGKITKWYLMRTFRKAVTFILSSAHETDRAGSKDITLLSLLG